MWQSLYLYLPGPPDYRRPTQRQQTQAARHQVRRGECTGIQSLTAIYSSFFRFIHSFIHAVSDL